MEFPSMTVLVLNHNYTNKRSRLDGYMAQEFFQVHIHMLYHKME